MLNRAARISGQSSGRGTDSDWRPSRQMASRPAPPTTRQMVRKLHTGISATASFIAGQFTPQNRVMEASSSSPVRSAPCRAAAGSVPDPEFSVMSTPRGG